MKKVALVTGASSGIGLDVAKRLIDCGFMVYGAARRTEKMTPIEEKGGKIVFLDLLDDSSIESCVSEIIKNEGRIDLLVNNAGYGLGGSIEDVPVEEVKKQFQVNFFGMVKLIQLVLPIMRKNGSGKIINVSSIAGKFSSPFSGMYHASKYSVEAFSDALRMELKPFGIKVILVEPGLIKTDWGIIHGNNIRKYSGSGAYGEKALKVAAYYEKEYSSDKKLTPPEVIAKVIVKASVTKNPKRRYAAGKNALLFLFLKAILPSCIYDFSVGLFLS